jgi:hypothetical protein
LDTFALLAVDGDAPLVVGGTGADVWTLLAEPRTLPALVEFLAGRYAGDSEVISRDVAALLDTFVAARLALLIPG